MTAKAGLSCAKRSCRLRALNHELERGKLFDFADDSKAVLCSVKEAPMMLPGLIQLDQLQQFCQIGQLWPGQAECCVV